MPHRPRSISLAGLFGSLLLVATVLAPSVLTAQDFGRITGSVTRAEGGTGLTGAQVRVVGTSLGAVAGENGNYTIVRVPAGTHTVRVTYIGRSPVEQQVTVVDGQTVTADFSMGTVRLQAMVIEGTRAEGQAAALSRQLNAPNITNVVASDQIGRFPDASAPEAVQRLPGVMLQRDQGEGRYIGIRGASPANTQVTVNGEQVPSPEAEVRQIALDAIPVGVLEAIEVSKAITPDMDAEAIGGSVNLVTMKAPDQRVFSLEGAGGYAPIREAGNGLGAITYGQRTNDGRFGFLFSGSYSRREFGSDDLEAEYDIGDPGMSDDALVVLEPRHYTLWRSRAGGTASLDYRLNESSTLYLTGLYSELQDQEQRRALVHEVEDEELVFAHKNRLEKLRTLNLGAGGDHIFGQGIGLDYRATVTQSSEKTPFDNEIEFLHEGISYSPSLATPTRPQSNPSTSPNAAEFLFDQVANGGSVTENTDYVGTVSLSLPYNLGERATGSFKFGAKYRDKSKNQDVTELEYGLNDTSGDIILGSGLGSAFDVKDYQPGQYPFPANTTSEKDVKDFTSRYASSLEGEEVLEEKTNEFDISEQTAAVYAMTELSLSPQLLILPGVRYEYTTVKSTANEWNEDAETLLPTSGDNSYGRFFPMLHMRYRVTPQTNVRAAFTTAIQRPNFVDLIPFRIRDGDDVELGNPDLKPIMSRNYDLLLEHYDSRIGVMSAGVFYKELVDPIFMFVTDNAEGGETTQPANTESGRIYGFEAAVQQQLSFLPAPFDGLGVYGNYTYTDSRARQADGVRTRLPGQSKHSWNAALSYEKRRFSGQVSLNHVGSALLELGGPAGANGVREEDVFIDDRMQLDLSVSYFVTNATQLYVEATNLTNEPYRTYQTYSSRVRQLEYYRPALMVGLRLRP